MRALRTKRAVRWASLLAVFALVAAACVGGETEATTTTEADVVETTATPSTVSPPETAPPTAAGDCPDAFCVKYNIHPDAAWADGVAVTANDFAFTYDTIMNDQLDITSREGYNKMSGYEVVDDKTFLAIFSEIYAPWQSLFSYVVPEHELAAKPFNTYWDDIITLGSGPFAMTEWVKDERIVLERNANYWASEERQSGAPLGDVQTINFVFLEDSQTQIDALSRQDVDMLNPQPQDSLVEEVDAIEGVEWESSSGGTWDHIDFNHSDPLLSQLFIRQAFAQGINRDAIVEAIVRPIIPGAQPLGNTIWWNSTSAYEDHFGQYPYDPVAAEAYLTDNGCVRGEDGIYECDGQRLSFSWVTTAGSEDRELQFDLAQEDLVAIGIEVNAAFVPASLVFDKDFLYGDSTVWQIFNFAWIGDPDPARFNTIYYCEGRAPSGFGERNVTRFCNDEMEQLVRATDAEVDPDARAALYNEADAIYLDNVATIPTYQKPTFFAWNSEISGPKDNPSLQGALWNVAAWSGMDLITFGVDQQPQSMNGLELDGALDATSLIAEGIIEGAYEVTPDFEYVPVLITDAEPIVPAG